MICALCFWSLAQLQSKLPLLWGVRTKGWVVLRRPRPDRSCILKIIILHLSVQVINYVYLALFHYSMLILTTQSPSLPFELPVYPTVLVSCHMVAARPSWSSDLACKPVCTRLQPMLFYYRTELFCPLGVQVKSQSLYNANGKSQRKSFSMLTIQATQHLNNFPSKLCLYTAETIQWKVAKYLFVWSYTSLATLLPQLQVR